ncbi:MAG: phage head morphogenesis protein, partial [Moraxellaceae bacterium]
MASNAEAQKAITAMLALHSAYLYRANTKAANELIGVFNKQTKAMVASLAEQLDDLTEIERKALAGGLYDTPRLKQIKKDIDSWSAELTTALTDGFTASAIALAGHEVNYTTESVNKALDHDKTVKLTPEKVYKQARRQPITGGALLDEVFINIADGAKDKTWNVIRQGVTDGQSNSQIIKALRGSPDFNYEDSLLQSSRRDIETMVRTSRNHISNVAYNETYAALGVDEVVFVATLDGRTSKTCASYDGARYKVGDPHPIPPMHPNCRSVLAPVFDKDLIGNRPAIGSNGVTQVNANTTYASWFKNQSAEFQKEWLGASKYKLYKQGSYSLDRFIDPIKGELSLNELRLRDQRTFK